MRRYLTEVQQRELLGAAKRMSDPLAVRDYHWMGALILSGMRIQEFSRLTADLVRLALRTGWLVSLKENCKGKRHANEYLVTQPLRRHLEALLALSDEVLQELPATVARPLQQPLVWGRLANGAVTALSVRSYEDRLKLWVGAANLDPRCSPHWLRHTRAMNIMRNTRARKDAIRVVKLALNHSSIRSTGVYTGMCREEYEEAIRFVDGGRVPRRVARQMAEHRAAL